jgi:hypothetical protein
MYPEVSLSERAVREYLTTLAESEKKDFTFATVEEVLENARALEKEQGSSSRSRRVFTCIEPVVKFLQRYARVIDTIIQYDVQPSALAWGCLRFLLTVSYLNCVSLKYRTKLCVTQVAASSTAYFTKLLEMMGKIGDVLSLYERYAEMLSDSESFKKAFANVYYDIVCFLWKARRVFKSSGEAPGGYAKEGRN